MKIGINGRAMTVQFGKLEAEKYGSTMSSLHFKCNIDQLSRNPIKHVRTIRLIKTRYRDPHQDQQFGTHFQCEFLNDQNLLLGKFENVDEQSIVEAQWKEHLGWQGELLTKRDIAILADNEKIVGVKLGLHQLDPTKDYVESFKFMIAKFNI